MPADFLVPVSVLDDALAKAYAAARALLTLVSVTLHHQFPEGAYLVLTRPIDYEDADSVRLHSIRDARGEMVQDLRDPDERHTWRLPEPPEHIAALWGCDDPRDPSVVLNLIQRIDDLARYEYLDFLPAELWTADEVKAEGTGTARTPLGLRLAAEHCPVHGVACDPDDHIEPPTVGGEAPQMVPAPVVVPCACGRPDGVCAPCCGSSACPTVCSDCTTWRPTC